MPGDVHIINKQLFEFECVQSEHAFQIEKKFDHSVQYRISKIIDRACNLVSSGNADVRIPLLKIDLGKISFDSLEEEIVLAFEKKFYEKLSEWKNYPGDTGGMVSTKSLTPSFEVLAFFLLTGRLPWFVGKQGEAYLDGVFDEVFATESEALRNLIFSNLDNDTFIGRLTGQVGETQLDRIISLLDPGQELFFNIETAIKEVVEEIILLVQLHFEDITLEERDFEVVEESKPERLWQAVKMLTEYLENYPVSYALYVRKIALEFILKALSGKNNISAPGQFYELFEKLLAEKFEFGTSVLHSILLKGQLHESSLANVMDKGKSRLEQVKINLRKLHAAENNAEKSQDFYDAVKEAKNKPREDRIIFGKGEPGEEAKGQELKYYVSNAGLVLIANYLPVFFNELDLLEEGNFVSRNGRVKAIFLLYFICTGREEVPEYILPLNKILCGFPLEEPLPSFLSLTKEEKDECEELLNEIINNWQKLGNTSLEAFRESFLNREGILTLEEHGWKLQVERRGYDVLLESLPWAFQHIKLSWMEALITTEW